MDQIRTGKFIAQLRKDAGLTQAALAEKLGITDRAVSKWENGKCLPDASVMLMLCGILGISVNELLAGERIVMENYKEIAENNLAQAVKIEENKNIRLKKAGTFITWSGAVISLVMIICGALVARSSPAVALVLCFSGIAAVTVMVIYSSLLEYDSGYYHCPHCGHRYTLPWIKIVLAPHVDSDLYLKCPECGKKDWHRKMMTKE